MLFWCTQKCFDWSFHRFSKYLCESHGALWTICVAVVTLFGVTKACMCTRVDVTCIKGSCAAEITDGKPVVGTVTETLWANATVNAQLEREMLSIQSCGALCSCILPEFCPLWESWSSTLLLFPSLSLSRPILTILLAFFGSLISAYL